VKDIVTCETETDSNVTTGAVEICIVKLSAFVRKEMKKLSAENRLLHFMQGKLSDR